jgi:hypothetical protein
MSEVDLALHLCVQPTFGGLLLAFTLAGGLFTIGDDTFSFYQSEGDVYPETAITPRVVDRRAVCIGNGGASGCLYGCAGTSTVRWLWESCESLKAGRV